eukprot:CAMPEP_0170552702 /NCGR_PEP_ID=MMETSP0211-20121228/10584_1 /TAXON_ID=311385 /ORGANISM="Pseudokeronopsis sp., Strain OXSARD2" /LENGTH=69 /DNA_ID=CAMNT_0010860601 /DNA_START=860 /DNA_END=1066 /DNA_ORIENTATION=+
MPPGEAQGVVGIVQSGVWSGNALMPPESSIHSGKLSFGFKSGREDVGDDGRETWFFLLLQERACLVLSW